MKIKYATLLMIALVFFLQSNPVFAQKRPLTVTGAENLYVVSAKAGGVNFVQGDVTVKRKYGKSGLLLKGDTLEIGDIVTTGANGKVEILLNPGSYARLAENTTFEFETTSLDDLKLKLASGSAMFEVITDSEFGFAVNTPKAVFQIIKSGVYRVDTLANGTGKIEVWKGRAAANGTELKGGRQATVDGAQTSVAKFDRDEKDALETWSKSRAKSLVKLNAGLQNRATRLSLMSSYYRTRWSLYNSYGLWLFDAAYGSYCFMPFGYGWSSPYGFFYPRDIWYYNLPPVIYYPPAPVTNNPTLASAGSSVRGNPRVPTTSGSSAPARSVPPFVRVQNDIGQFPAESFGDVFSPSTSSPIRNPTVSAPIVITPQPSSSSDSVFAPSTAPPRKGN